MIAVGCCGFPEARGKYYKKFDVVEVQQTFYQPPRLQTVHRWRMETPEGFEFALKAWQLITHPPSSPTYRKLRTRIPDRKTRLYGFFRPTDEVMEAWETTQAMAGALRARVIVFQCPPSFTSTSENIRNIKGFFAKVERQGRIFIWEPRGDWKKKEIENVCGDTGLIPCLDPFSEDFFFSGLIYLRLHGRTGYRYSYTKEELKAIRATVAQAPDSYVMFNNISMLKDAARFKVSLS